MSEVAGVAGVQREVTFVTIKVISLGYYVLNFYINYLHSQGVKNLLSIQDEE